MIQDCFGNHPKTKLLEILIGHPYSGYEYEDLLRIWTNAEERATAHWTHIDSHAKLEKYIKKRFTFNDFQEYAAQNFKKETLELIAEYSKEYNQDLFKNLYERIFGFAFNGEVYNNVLEKISVKVKESEKKRRERKKVHS